MQLRVLFAELSSLQAERVFAIPVATEGLVQVVGIVLELAAEHSELLVVGDLQFMVRVPDGIHLGDQGGVCSKRLGSASSGGSCLGLGHGGGLLELFFGAVALVMEML